LKTRASSPLGQPKGPDRNCQCRADILDILGGPSRIEAGWEMGRESGASRPSSTRADDHFFLFRFLLFFLLHFVDEMGESCYKEGFCAVCSRV
jgi:hypothetical protein